MPEHTYRNFDLLIEGTGAGGYRARVLGSPAGETGPVPVVMPFSDLEVENFLLKIGRPRRHAVRGVNSPEAAAIRQFGGRLFDAVFHDNLRETLARSVDEVEGQDAGLRLRLRLADCPELADLPWEYIYDPRARRFLALSQWTPVVRYLDLPHRIRPLSVRPPLRILALAASPTDFDPLNVDTEWVKVRDALAELQRAGRVQVERVPTGTLAALRRELRQGDYHVFHFVGHGRYNPDAGDGELALEGPGGRAQLISGAELGALLHDYRLRLAVLNSCEGARGGRTDPYAGTAQSVIFQGIPAVVAMQFEITDQAAITFAQNLYEAVADGLPLDAAMAEARNAILDQPNPVEWATPVLYLRAPDGRIFDVTKPDTPPPGTTEPTQPDHRREAQLLDQARAQHRLGHYDATLRLLNDLLTLNPTYPETAELRSAALHDKRLADIYRRAVEAETAADWPTAVASYTEILDTDPTYRDAAARRAACERRQQIADLQAELRHHATAESWQAVLDIDEQLRRLDSATADPGGLATRARRALDQAERAADLDRRYAQAHAHEDASDWEAAVICYSEIVDIDAGYRDAAQRRDACRHQLRVTALRAELDRQSAAREAEERAAREAQEQARREAEEQAAREAEERAAREAQEQARREAEKQARREAAERLQPRLIDDDVRFSVFRPRILAAEQWTKLLVVAHKSQPYTDPIRGVVDPLERVRRLVEEHYHSTPIDTTSTDAHRGLGLGSSLRVVLDLPGVDCRPPAYEFTWLEDVHEAPFLVRPPAQLAGTSVRGFVRIWCGPLILGELSVTIPVALARASAAMAGAAPDIDEPIHRYRKIFPSYSHRDREMVEIFRVVAHALGDEYLQDVVSLRSGERWDERLLKLIVEADVFQLFWSRNSMRSPHCRREWEHALALRRPSFIRPLYWEDPLPEDPTLGLPPSELRTLHFAQVPPQYGQQATAQVGAPVSTLPAPGWAQDPPAPPQSASAPRLPPPPKRTIPAWEGASPYGQQRSQPSSGREAEEQARREAEERAAREAQEQAAREAEEQAAREAEKQARREAAERLQQEAKRLQREADERLQRQAEQLQRDADERARKETVKPQEQAQREAMGRLARGGQRISGASGPDRLPPGSITAKFPTLAAEEETAKQTDTEIGRRPAHGGRSKSEGATLQEKTESIGRVAEARAKQEQAQREAMRRLARGGQRISGAASQHKESPGSNTPKFLPPGSITAEFPTLAAEEEARVPRGDEPLIPLLMLVVGLVAIIIIAIVIAASP